MSDSSKGKILLADDEQTFINALADLLRIEGYECQTVYDGLAAAAELNTRQNYDLLIADVRMPGNTKLELIEHLSKLAEGLTAILLTGYPEMSTAVSATNLPVLAYLTKPIEMSDLLPVVQRGVTQTSLHRANREITDRLRRWLEDSEMVSKLLARNTPNLGIGPDAFVNLSVRNILGCLSELDAMWQKAADSNDGTPAHDVLREALEAAMAAFESSTSAFKR